MSAYAIPPPVEPMLSKVADEIPRTGDFVFEPKWDGFRAIVFRGKDYVYIQSRDLKPLDRYFPELHDGLIEALPAGSVIDGEIVIAAPDPAQRGRGGRGGDIPIRVTRMQQKAPRVPAALERAGIPYAFSSEGLQNPADFVRGVGRAVREGGLTQDQALRALTVSAAKIAGASDRVGTLAKGRIANVIVAEGELFSDQPRIRRVFVDGRPVNIDVAAAQPQGRGRDGQ